MCIIKPFKKNKDHKLPLILKIYMIPSRTVDRTYTYTGTNIIITCL